MIDNVAVVNNRVNKKPYFILLKADIRITSSFTEVCILDLLDQNIY